MDDARLQQLRALAKRDANILGLVLTGSRGKGFGREESDYDVLMVVRPEAWARYHARFTEDITWQGFDWWIIALTDLEQVAADWREPLAWEEFCNHRYGFADVPVLLDKTGTLQHLVDERGFIPDEQRYAVVRAALGAYTNSLYRSLKCVERGDPLGGRLESADAIGHGLTAIFALEGRHRPYYGYLARELAARPLRQFPMPEEALMFTLGAILDSADPAAQRRLLAAIESTGRPFGCGDAFDEWEERWEWMRDG